MLKKNKFLEEKISEKYLYPHFDDQTPFPIKKFYLWGGKSSGKTSWLIWLCKHLASKYSQNKPWKKINFIWARNTRKDALQTFFWLKNTLGAIKKERLIISKSELSIKFKNNLISYSVVYFSSSRYELQNEESIKLTGNWNDYADYNIVVFEESYFIHPKEVDALILASAKNVKKEVLQFYIFNSWSKNNWLVKKCADVVPFRPEIMKVEGFDEFEDLKNQTYYIRLNHLIVWKNKDNRLLSPPEHDLLKNNLVANENVVLWGDDGISQGGVYFDIQKDIEAVFISEDEILKKLNQFENKNYILGIDFGYVRDNTAIVLTAHNGDYSKALTLDCMTINNFITPKNSITQARIIFNFVCKMRRIYNFDELNIVSHNAIFEFKNDLIDIFIKNIPALPPLFFTISKEKRERMLKTERLNKIGLYFLPFNFNFNFTFGKLKNDENVINRINNIKKRIRNRFLYYNAQNCNAMKIQFENTFWIVQPGNRQERGGTHDLLEADEYSKVFSYNH